MASGNSSNRTPGLDVPDGDPSAQQSRFVLGVDLDGVCADFYGRMRAIVAEWRGVDPGSLPPETSFSLAEWGVQANEYRKIHRFAVTQQDLFRTMDMIPGAGPVLRRLSSQGVRVRIITHRLVIEHFHREAVAQTVEWLDRHAIPYWDLCFMGDKGAVDADLYIDDAPQNITALRDAGRDFIVFSNGTNRSLDVAARNRAESWEQVGELVLERLLAAGVAR